MRRGMMLSGFLLLLLVLPAWGQTPGVWQEIPNSSVVPLIPTGCGGNDIPAAVIGAWVDGDYHPPSKSFVIPRGGGHGDNCFNGGVAFSTETLTWKRTTDRGQFVVMIAANPDSAFTNPYKDEPQSVHSYGAVAMMHGTGKLWTSGGIYWSRPGNSDTKTWWYDPTKTTVPTAYARKANRPGGYGTFAVGDPTDGAVLFRINGGFFRYTPATDSYGQLFALSGGLTVASSSWGFDTVGRKLYRFERKSVAPWSLKLIELQNLVAKEQMLATEGDTLIETTTGAGLFFDAGKLWAFGLGPVTGQGAMYSLDPAACGKTGQPACRWVRHLPPSGPTPPRSTPNGMWKKWFNGFDGYYYAIIGGGNVWRIAAGSAAPPPVTYRLAVTSVGSTGAGTVTGEGTYPAGALAPLIATPEPGSAAGPVTGSAGCQLGVITMDEHKACNVPLLDVQVPVIVMTQPADKLVMKVTTPIVYTVADNMPGVESTVFLDGAPYTGQDLDPSVLMEGAHQLVVQAVDDAGNTNQVTRNFISVIPPPPCPTCPTCPVCPTCPTCPTCPVCPPPTGSIAPNTWVLHPEKPANAPVSLRAGKHARMVYSAKHNGFLIAGGDRYGSDAGQPAVELLNPHTGQATLLSPPCPAAPLLMPNFPDNAIVVMDEKRNRVVVDRGFYFGQPIDVYPAGTLTPSALSGTITLTSSVDAFEPWMLNRAYLNLPTEVRQVHPTSFALVAKATLIAPYVDKRTANALVTTAFPVAGPIPAKSWQLSDVLAGGAARYCKRNLYAGDLGVKPAGTSFDLTTHKWIEPTWPTPPTGNGSDAGGPSMGVIDTETDALWNVRKGVMQRLDLATNLWTKILMGDGLPGGSYYRTALKNANSYRSGLVIYGTGAARSLYMVSNAGPTKPPEAWVPGTGTGSALIEIPMNDPTRGRSYSFPAGYVGQPDDVEPCLILDPKNKLLMHVWHETLTGDITHLYLFDLATKSWEVRPVPVTAERPKGGACVWDPLYEGLRIWGRKVGTLPGYFTWMYRVQR